MTTARELVRWGQEPLAFELATSDPALAARAREVFALWPAPVGRQPAARFEVSRIADDDVVGPGGANERGPGWQARVCDGDARSSTVTADEALRWVELRAVQSFLPRHDGALALHGALADVGGRALLIIGPPNAGKSSLACALWRSGAALLSDDVALVDLATGAARPGPRRVALRHGSRSLLGDELWQRIVTARASAPTDEGWCFHPGEIDGRPLPRTTRVGAVIFLERRARAEIPPATIARIAPAHAVLAWLPYVVAQRALDTGEAIRRIAPLAERVPAYDLARGPLAAMAANARAALDGGC